MNQADSSKDTLRPHAEHKRDTDAFRLFVGSAIAFALFLVITWFVHQVGSLNDLDLSIVRTVAHLRNSLWNGPMIDLTSLGSTTVLAILTTLGFFFLRGSQRAFSAIHLVAASVGAIAILSFSKLMLLRERPPIELHLLEVGGYSYPSGHALSSATFFLTVAAIATARLAKPSVRAAIFLSAALLVVAISLSRIYLGVHYPTDILGGLCLGTAWALLLAGFAKKVT